jgi:hypothetical protein
MTRQKQRMILVVGTGRSGTTWLGRILDQHPRIHTTIEDPVTFRLAKGAALNPHAKKYVPALAAAYGWRCARAYPRHFADKSHPVLWVADDISRLYSRAVFVGIERNPYGTVASMLKHDGVLRWMKDWRKYPVPNRFLGITEEIAPHYDEMSLVERSALRWRAHYVELESLADRLPDRVLIVQYEDLVSAFSSQVALLWKWLGVESASLDLEVKEGSRDKWRHELSANDQRDIERVTGVSTAGLR